MTFSLQDENRNSKKLKSPPVRRGVWFVSAFLAALLLYGGWNFSGKRAAGQGPPAYARSVPVVVATASQGDIHVYLTGLGTVTALYTATILTQATGQVMEVPFKEGDKVKKGALLVQIDPRPFEAVLLQAEGQLARDQALLEEARIDFKRYDTLARQDSIAQQQRDDQLYLVHQYEGTVKLDEGLVKSAKINLDFTRITAPFTGRMGLRLVDPGNIVHTTDTTGVAVITKDQPAAVIFPIPEDNLPSIMKKFLAKENLTVDAYNRDQNRKIASGLLEECRQPDQRHHRDG